MNAKYLTRLKVSATYLSIIMLMSVVFSFVIYKISSNELYRQRNVPIPRTMRELFNRDEFDNIRAQNLNEGLQTLRARLILFNILTLLIGSGLSYALALKSLEPIERALERQDRFTSDASHEMRTPLTIMKSDIEITLRDPKLSLRTAKETLLSNLEEINKLEALTGGLLQLARQENTDLPKQKIKLKDLLDQAKNDVQKPASSKKIKITLPNVKDQTVLVEPTSFKQALVIFLDNSIKYSPSGSTIKIDYKSQPINHLIKIIDEGSGIAPEDLGHIFDRFYRSDKSRTKTQKTNGYGLGLSIAKQIIDDHTGSINIKSKLGKGTEVNITLPKK